MAAMKNKTFFKLFIILVLASVIRFCSLNTSEGLWNDEYVAWLIASKKSFSEFINIISKNCHTPLYYLLLKLWLNVFPDSDISLRVSSVITSLLTVIAMFFLGKEYKDEKTGLLCALFCSLSSFYIYFAREVRPYSLLSLITALLIFYCIKTLKSGRKRFFSLFIILNALLCSAHTLGVIFSFFIILYTSVYLYKNFEEWKIIIKNVKKIFMYIFPLLVILILISPFIFSITFSKSLSQFWSNFSYFKILFSFTDYFSPIQINITNSPDTLKNINYMFIFFVILPSAMAFFAILKGCLIKDKILKLLLLSCVSFFSVILIFVAAGKLILLTKYSCEIYPVLILTFVCGVMTLKNKIVQNAFFIIYFSIASFYLYFSPISAPKLVHPEGNRLPVILIQQSRLKPGDYIIFTYYDTDKFERYFKNKNDFNIFSISKFNFNKPVYGNKNYYETISEGKILYRDKFKEFPNKNIVDWADANIIKQMKKGDKAGIIYLNGVSFFTNEKLNEIALDDKKYKKTSFVFMTFSMLKNNLMYAFKDDFKIDSITQSGSWILIVYEKY